MKYNNIVSGFFINRENRFISYCLIDGKKEKVYVPNTGRCKELFIEGRKVYLTYNNDPKRKTKYTLISIYKDNLLINIDSQAPNKVVEEAIINKTILEDYNFTKVKREVTFNKSRFDFYLEGYDNKDEFFKAFLEVKGVTLEENGHTTFPDAPTQRGLKHLKELDLAKEKGFKSFIIFVIQMSPVKDFAPNSKIQIEFSNQLKKSIDNGVHCLCYQCDVTKNTLDIKSRIPLANF